MGDDSERGAKRPGLAQFLFDELRSAFQDIRQKLVEEGWFGRVVSAAPVVEMDQTHVHGDLYGDDHQPLRDSHTSPEHRPSFEELWGARARTADPPEIPKQPDGHDFDR
ncbi:MAG TPA: hypothetical protein VGF97_00160 [Rhizomicrobium sp.]|jgi:hypothetical protein